MDKIVVLDFGSQYSHLICRRIRDSSVYAELVSYKISSDELEKLEPNGIIFSGGPASIYNDSAPKPDKAIFELGIPILGICYGHQLIVNNFGGKVKRANQEYGSNVPTLKVCCLQYSSEVAEVPGNLPPIQKLSIFQKLRVM